MSLSRFEAFSDSVFAIAATVLVFNLHTPDPGPSPGPLSAARFFHLWPQLLGFITSFIVIGVLWINHHALFHFLRKVDRVTLVINLVLLMCVAFVPYPTALIAAYGQDRQVVMFFGGTLAVTGFVFSALWFHAVSQYLTSESHIDERFVRDASLWTLGYPLAYVVATLLALIDPRLSIAAYAIIPIVYLLPGVIDQQLHTEMNHRRYSEH